MDLHSKSNGGSVHIYSQTDNSNSPTSPAICRTYPPARRTRVSIASRMTAFICRKHLYPSIPDVAASAVTVDYFIGTPIEDPDTKWGPKKEVCLIVEPADEDARRVYEKVGFKCGEESCSLSNGL